MRRDFHTDLETSLPEGVIFRLRKPGAVRKHVERHGTDSVVDQEFNFRDRVIDPSRWNDTIANQTIRRDGAVVLGQEGVVRADQRAINVLVRHRFNRT